MRSPLYGGRFFFSDTIVLMAVKWGIRRQILYYIVGVVMLAVLLAASYQLFFKKVPTCFDQVQNNGEAGVDCGGSCMLLCPDVARAPTVLWARAFQSAPNTYTAAAYIQNNNVAVGAGAKQAHYSFQLLDSNNILIAEREGVVDIPPMQTVPIVEIGIDAGNRQVARTFFNFDPNLPLKWNKVDKASVQALRISNTSAYQDGKLSTTVINDAFEDAKKVQVVAVLFDEQGVARAASKSTLSKIARRSSQAIVFTWPETVPNITRAEVTVLPSF